MYPHTDPRSGNQVQNFNVPISKYTIRIPNKQAYSNKDACAIVATGNCCSYHNYWINLKKNEDKEKRVINCMKKDR
jgi:hypothetical protein